MTSERPERRTRRFGKAYLGYGVDAPQLLDSGEDAPLSPRGRWIWWGVVAVLIVAIAVLVAASR